MIKRANSRCLTNPSFLWFLKNFYETSFYWNGQVIRSDSEKIRIFILVIILCDFQEISKFSFSSLNCHFLKKNHKFTLVMIFVIICKNNNFGLKISNFQISRNSAKASSIFIFFEDNLLLVNSRSRLDFQS